MKILVTGGTGFIGQHLVKALVKKGHQVKIISRNCQKAKTMVKMGVVLVKGDLADKKFLADQLTGMEAVFHLAAIPAQIWGIPRRKYQKVNLGYTKNLLAAARKREVKKFVFCSSIQAARALTFYGQTKLEAEKAVKKSGLVYVIIRPGIVYGPGEKRSISKTWRLVKKGFFPLPGGGHKKLAIVFVDDLVRLFLKVLSPKIKNKTFWAIGEEISLKDLVTKMSQALAKPCLKIFLPMSLAKIIINQDQLKMIDYNWHFKIPDWQKRLWQPKVKFEEGIKHGYC